MIRSQAQWTQLRSFWAYKDELICTCHPGLGWDAILNHYNSIRLSRFISICTMVVAKFKVHEGLWCRKVDVFSS